MSRLRQISARQGDVLLAAALSVALVLELALSNTLTGPPLANYGLGLVITVAVAWRRPWPVWVVVAQLLAAIASAAFDGDLTETPLTPFLSVIVGMYSIGYYAPRPWTDRGLVIGVAGMVIADVVGDTDAPGELVGTLMLAILAPWAAGRAAAVWAARARALEAANLRLRAEQEQRSVLAVADERSRIARELHDVVAHSISIMVVQSEGAKRMMDRDPKRALVALEQIEGTGRAALVEMRRLLGVLRKDDEAMALAPQPGTGGLDVLVNRAQEAGLDVSVGIDGKPRPLPAGVDVSVYRIIQEALTNTLKHAGPVRSDVLVRYSDEAIEVEIVDSGPANGFVAPTADPDNPQHGLLGMRERVKIYDGEIVTGPCEDGRDGYRVWARIPLTDK
jgi:signal transduction histidine kinase